MIYKVSLSEMFDFSEKNQEVESRKSYFKIIARLTLNFFSIFVKFIWYCLGGIFIWRAIAFVKDIIQGVNALNNKDEAHAISLKEIIEDLEHI